MSRPKKWCPGRYAIEHIEGRADDTDAIVIRITGYKHDGHPEGYVMLDVQGDTIEGRSPQDHKWWIVTKAYPILKREVIALILRLRLKGHPIAVDRMDKGRL